MLNKRKRLLLAAVAVTPLLAGSAWAEGLISIIVTDPANPYWFTEGEVAKATAEELGYTANGQRPQGRHQHREHADRHRDHQQVGGDHPRPGQRRRLDRRGARRRSTPASRCSSSTPRSTRTASPRRSSSRTTPRARRSAPRQWVEAVGDTGNYVELFGNPADNNAATRSNGYETVLTQYPDLEKAAQEVANWDRTQGFNKMQSMLQANPDIIGVISGNDEMALGAIAALKEAGKLDQVKVGGFDGSPDAVAAVKAGEMQYTVLQPVAVFSAEAVRQADNFIKTGETGADSEKQLFDCVLITKDNVDQMVRARSPSPTMVSG